MRWPSMVFTRQCTEMRSSSLVSAKGKTFLQNVRFVLTRATQTFLGIYHDAIHWYSAADSRIQISFVLPEDLSVASLRF